ncbi:MAG: hypothetical protein HQL32_13920 [Planctomycetes bacterium]|nr:hypothetical protein [Planctomycetota bacterium]
MKLLNWLPLLFIVLISLVYSYNANHSDCDFVTFQMYRMVHNNIHHPEVTNYLSMVHPAKADDIYLYSSMLTPGASLYHTLFCKLAGLSVFSLRLSSVLIYSFIFLGLMYVSKNLGFRYNEPLWLYFLAPGVILFAPACEMWLTSIPPIIFMIGLLIDKRPIKLKWLYFFLLSFCAVWFIFTLYVYIIFLFLAFAILDFFNQNKQEPLCSRKIIISVLCGGFLAILLGLIQQVWAPDGTMDYFSYFKLRASHRVGGASNVLSLYPYMMTRLWSFLSQQYPLFILTLISIGLIAFSDRKLRDRNEKILGISMFIYLAYLGLFAKTTIHHYFFSYFFLLLTPPLFLYAYRKRGSKKVGWVEIIFLLIISISGLYEIRKTNFWVNQRNDIDTFLENMSNKDYLLRDTPFNTWPLNLNAPEKTLYIDVNQRSNQLKDLDRRIVSSYAVTQNTIYYAPQFFNHESKTLIPQGSALYMITKEPLDNHQIIYQDRGYYIIKLLEK